MALYPARVVTTQGVNLLVTAPAVEPVGISLVKEQLRILTTDDDTYLTGLLADARKFIESITGLAFITQTWQLTMDGWPAGITPWWDGVREMPVSALSSNSGAVHLPSFPLQSVTSVTTYDDADVGTAENLSTQFFIDTKTRPGRLRLKSGGTWTVPGRATNGIEILYVAGFGANSGAVPAIAQRAIAVMTAYLYGHRGDGCEPLDAFRKSGAAELLGEYTKARI